MSAQQPWVFLEPDEIKIPFENDLLDRKLFAAQITPYLDRLRPGGVMTLDAPWGEGKSWFGKHWRKMLEDEGQHKTCWIDAFERDYIDDPFELVTSELIDALDWRENEELITKTVSVLKIVDKSFGAIAKGVGRGLGIIASASMGSLTEVRAGEALGAAGADFAAQVVSDGTSYLKDRLLAHSYEKLAIREFREAVASEVAALDKPLVVFVDELDRCRPDFAVRLIECIKHFFEVPNLVFVLLLNRDQLEKAIKGVYGSEVDANLYLHKFIHLPLRLPQGMNVSAGGPKKVFIGTLLQERFKYHRDFDGWTNYFTEFGEFFGLSLRDLERCCTLAVMTNQGARSICAFLICLKVADTKTFRGIVELRTGACTELIERINSDPRVFETGRLLAVARDFLFAWEKFARPIESGFFPGMHQMEDDARPYIKRFIEKLETGFDTYSEHR